MIMQHLRIASGGENFSHSRKYRSRTIASDFLVRDAVRSEAVSVSRIPIWMGIYWEILRFFSPVAHDHQRYPLDRLPISVVFPPGNGNLTWEPQAVVRGVGILCMLFLPTAARWVRRLAPQ